MITRCVACARVRIGADMTWTDHPGILDGEVAVICATCAEERRQLQAQEYYRNVRRTVRRQTLSCVNGSTGAWDDLPEVR